MDFSPAHLSQTLSQARTLEELVRPLLVTLEQVAQLESTYLTTIDFPNALQHVLYAHNTLQMQIPEGLTVPWTDTLCKRSLSEGRTFTNDVQSCWGDSDAAHALGIRTYVSTPIRLSDGQIYGTLCAASARTCHWSKPAEDVLQLFAQLIAQQIEREQTLQRLEARNQELSSLALTDALTQLPNRAAIRAELNRLLARAQRDDSHVLVAFLDLDGFKQINDQWGHHIGDLLLQTVARQLQANLRDGDLVGRIGGDEFVLLGATHSHPSTHADLRQSLQQRLHLATVCTLQLPEGQWLHYPGASVGVLACDGNTPAEDALQQADAAMYRHKSERRSAPSHA